MIKKTGIVLLICCFFIAALPVSAPAAPSVSQQSLVKRNIAVLQTKLQAAAAGDSTPLHALTVQFLDDVKRFGFKSNTADLQLAVEQYVSDIEEQVAAEALEPACVAPLAYNIYVNGSSMLQKVVSGDAPVCMAISLSLNAASIISAKNTYDVCSGAKTQPDIANSQNALQYYSFFANVLSVVLCNPTAGVQTYISLLYNFLSLFLF